MFGHIRETIEDYYIDTPEGAEKAYWKDRYFDHILVEESGRVVAKIDIRGGLYAISGTPQEFISPESAKRAAELQYAERQPRWRSTPYDYPF